MSDYTSDQLYKLIKNKYKSPDNSFEKTVILPEVPNGTGGFQSRWADAVVFEMWPSKGLSRSAFEIKVSRQDFLNELRQPDKHQWCKECFHYFWFVAPKEVIQEAELPTNVGWMYPSGNRLCVKRHAVRNDNPHLDDKLLAAFMRAAGKGIESAYRAAASELLETNQEYRDALSCKKAIEIFLNKRNYWDHHFNRLEFTEEQLVKTLEDATCDEQLKSDRDRLNYKLMAFEADIRSLIDMVVVIASKSLLARDELGTYLSGFSSSEHIKKHIKEHKNELRDLLINLENEVKKEVR